MSDITVSLLTEVVRCIIAVLGVIFTGVVLPWVVNTGIPWLKEKHLYSIVRTFVLAAEKQNEAGTLTVAKYDYVVSLLEARGITVSDEVRAVIEAAVKELDIEVGTAWQGLVEAVSEDDTEQPNA